MAPQAQEAGPDFADRTAKLKALLQGPPLTAAKIDGLLVAGDYALFSVEGPEDLYDLIRITAGSLLDDDGAVAIRNALGLGWTTDANLTERRMALLEQVDITMRALQKREDSGAQLLVRQMEVMRRMRPNLAQEVGTAELIADINQLRGQMMNEQSKLWLFLVALCGLLDKQLGHDRPSELLFGAFTFASNLDKLIEHKEFDASFVEEDADSETMKKLDAVVDSLGGEDDFGRRFFEAMSANLQQRGADEEDTERLLGFFLEWGGHQSGSSLMDLKQKVRQQDEELDELRRRLAALEGTPRGTAKAAPKA
jgi:hypothetical protein